METGSEPQSKVALVTGASRGIGRAIAAQLGRDGFDVAFCYRQSTEAAAELEAELRAMGRRVLNRACDLRDGPAVTDMMQAIDDQLGPLDVVVNCAGILRDGPLVTMTKEAWDDVLGSNLDSIFNVCRVAVFGFMKRKQGCIVNISSVAGVYGNPRQTNYCASKAGIIGFSKALAKEVGAFGIRVNVVAPGYIKTDMTRDLSPAITKHVMQNIPLRRLGEPEEVAEVVSFLVSSRARYITAQTIHVDGGLMI
jgi:3-oxoacyl-[acyl-carrier protein] reductase